MADYYSILEKTISGLPNNTPEIRNAVYKKARTAIETQLRNMNPVPSEEAIGSQLKLLEEAIVLINSEYSVPPPIEEQIPDPIPEPAEEIFVEPVVENIVYEAELPAEPAVSSELSQAVDRMPIASEPTTDSVVERVETAIDKIQTEAPETVGLDAASVAEPSPELDSVAVDPSTNDILDPIVDASSKGNELSDLGMDEKKSGGFLGKLIKLLIVLGLLGGAGYAVWKNKDALPDIVSNFMKPADGVEETVTPSESEQPEEEVAEQVIPEPVKPEAVEPEVAEPEIVDLEVTEPEIVEPEVTEEPETVTTEEPTQEETPSTTQQNGVIPIGEVAYLYEEGTAGSGATRTNAAITWEIKQESLKEGSAPESVVIGKMDVPEKAMSIDITLKRNIDEAVSASHMIEMRFNIPEDFAGKSVESIARFVMKTTEEAPGEPLAAVPVKVSEGNFLIALDNLAQAVALNTQLLKSSAWIDIPIVYGTGKRALITLEKGGTGERVFNEAFKDWQNR